MLNDKNCELFGRQAFVQDYPVATISQDLNASNQALREVKHSPDRETRLWPWFLLMNSKVGTEMAPRLN